MFNMYNNYIYKKCIMQLDYIIKLYRYKKVMNEDARLFKLFNNINYQIFKIKPEKTLDVIISIF